MDDPFSVIAVVGIFGRRVVLFLFGRGRDDDVLHVLVDDGGAGEALGRFDGAFAARLGGVMFAHAQEHVLAAQQLEDIVALLGQHDFEIAAGDDRLMRLDAAQRAVVSGVVFAGEQLFAVGSAKFEKEHLFPVFAGVDVGGIGLCRHDPANDPFSAVLGNAVGFVLFVVEIVFVLNRCVFEVFKVHMSLLGICFIFFVF